MLKNKVLKPVITNLTAEIEGITPTSVRRVMNDKQNNEGAFSTYLLLEEEIEKVVENVKLVRSIEKMLPFS